jgi:hypothetical protein
MNQALSKLLHDLDLQHFIPAMTQNNVDLSVLAGVTVNDSHLRMQPSLQTLLFKRCGFNQQELITLVEKIRKRKL